MATINTLVSLDQSTDFLVGHDLMKSVARNFVSDRSNIVMRPSDDSESGPPDLRSPPLLLVSAQYPKREQQHEQNYAHPYQP
jgi:hypothetical protein